MTKSSKSKHIIPPIACQHLYLSAYNSFTLCLQNSVTWPNVLMNVDNKRRFRSSYVAGDWNSLIDVVGDIPCFDSYSSSKKASKGAEDLDEIVSVVNGKQPKDEEWCVVKKEDACDESKESKEEKTQFDLILTAETCYTEVSCQQVARHLLDLLRADVNTSIGLVASKRFYFGTGGSAAYFRQCCDELKSDGRYTLLVEVVEVIDDGKSNIREIMSVRKVTKK